MPSIGIYRPPAARRLEEQNANAQEREQINDSYNGKNECRCPSDEKRNDASGISVFKNAITSIRTQKSKELAPKKTETGAKPTQTRQRRPDMKVYVPKARRNATEQKPHKGEEAVDEQKKLKKAEEPKRVEESKKVEDIRRVEEPKRIEECRKVDDIRRVEEPKRIEECRKVDDIRRVEEPKRIEECRKVEDTKRVTQPKSIDECKTIEDLRRVAEQKRYEILSQSVSVNREHLGRINSDYSDKTNGRTVDDEEEYLSPVALWIEAQNEIVDVKVPSQTSQPEVVSSDSSGANSLKGSLERICDSKKEKEKINAVHLNPDECDWETMFDDSGECLDPSLMAQLSSAVGAVTIEKPKSNYDTFKTKTLDMVSSEFPHVIEIYNFPPEFRLQDLMTVFSQFKNAGFEIKWVDDTHALGIFGNSQIVSEVLAFKHPFVKTRLLKDGTTLSKIKARRSAEHLLPYKPRPDTCPALARRLVTGALGVKLPTSREEREAEKKILSQARERKRLEAKQREEAWEGTFN